MNFIGFHGVVMVLKLLVCRRVDAFSKLLPSRKHTSCGRFSGYGRDDSVLCDDCVDVCSKENCRVSFMIGVG